MTLVIQQWPEVSCLLQYVSRRELKALLISYLINSSRIKGQILLSLFYRPWALGIRTKVQLTCPRSHRKSIERFEMFTFLFLLFLMYYFSYLKSIYTCTRTHVRNSRYIFGPYEYTSLFQLIHQSLFILIVTSIVEQLVLLAS